MSLTHGSGFWEAPQSAVAEGTSEAAIKGSRSDEERPSQWQDRPFPESPHTCPVAPEGHIPRGSEGMLNSGTRHFGLISTQEASRACHGNSFGFLRWPQIRALDKSCLRVGGSQGLPPKDPARDPLTAPKSRADPLLEAECPPVKRTLDHRINGS